MSGAMTGSIPTRLRRSSSGDSRRRVTQEHTIAVSAHFVGRGRAVEELVLRLAGAPLLEPQRGQSLLAEPHIIWHGDQVFRAPARVPA